MDDLRTGARGLAEYGHRQEPRRPLSAGAGFAAGCTAGFAALSSMGAVRAVVRPGLAPVTLATPRTRLPERPVRKKAVAS